MKNNKNVADVLLPGAQWHLHLIAAVAGISYHFFSFLSYNCLVFCVYSLIFFHSVVSVVGHLLLCLSVWLSVWLSACLSAVVCFCLSPCAKIVDRCEKQAH
eukprot:scpid68396/ scgid33375/ 